jgi:uncharacterized RDD family membrane protein YckC
MAEANLAGRGARLGAILIDNVIPQLLNIPITLGAGLPGHNSDWTSMLTDPQSIPAFAEPTKGIPSLVILGSLLMIALWGLQMVWLSTRGQTVGKRILKIKIVKTGTNQNGGFWTNVVLRGIVPPLAVFILVVIGSFFLKGIWATLLFSCVPLYFLIDALFILKADRRCVHDLVADTQVVNA